MKLFFYDRWYWLKRSTRARSEERLRLRKSSRATREQRGMNGRCVIRDEEKRTLILISSYIPQRMQPDDDSFLKRIFPSNIVVHEDIPPRDFFLSSPCSID